MQIEPEVDKAGMLEIYKKMLLIGIFQTEYGRWASNLPLHIKVLMAAMLVILLTAIASGIYFPTLPLSAETGQPIERTKPTRISWRVLHPSWIVSHKKKRKSPTQKSRQKERCFQITIWHYIQSRFSIDFTRLTSSKRKKTSDSKMLSTSHTNASIPSHHLANDNFGLQEKLDHHLDQKCQFITSLSSTRSPWQYCMYQHRMKETRDHQYHWIW